MARVRRSHLQEGTCAWVLHGEQLSVEETAEDGQVRGRLRNELLPRTQDQEAEGPVDMQRRYAVHQRHRDHTQMRVRQKMLLTTRPLHSTTVNAATAADHAAHRRRSAPRLPRGGRRRREPPATPHQTPPTADTPSTASRVDRRRVRVRDSVRRRLRHRRTVDRRHLVGQRLYISSSAVTNPCTLVLLLLLLSSSSTLLY